MVDLDQHAPHGHGVHEPDVAVRRNRPTVDPIPDGRDDEVDKGAQGNHRASTLPVVAAHSGALRHAPCEYHEARQRTHPDQLGKRGDEARALSNDAWQHAWQATHIFPAAARMPRYDSQEPDETSVVDPVNAQLWYGPQHYRAWLVSVTISAVRSTASKVRRFCDAYRRRRTPVRTAAPRTHPPACPRRPSRAAQSLNTRAKVCFQL